MRLPMLSVLVVAFAGCAATLPVPKQPDIFQPSLDYDEAWEKIVHIFGLNAWTIIAIEKASGIITSDWLLTDATYLDCGTPAPMETDLLRRELKIGVIVGQTKGVLVTVNVTGRNQYQTWGNVFPRTCYSTGLVETAFADALGVAYTPPPPPKPKKPKFPNRPRE